MSQIPSSQLYPILLFGGPPASGKTTIAEELCKKFEFSICISPDDIRTFIKTGMAHPITASENSRKQIKPAYLGVCDIVKRFTDIGFLCIITDAISVPTHYLLYLKTYPFIPFYLHAPLEEILKRNKERNTKLFPPEFYEKYIRSFYSNDITHHVLKERGWTLIDSNREIDVVVKEIIDIINSYGIR